MKKFILGGLLFFLFITVSCSAQEKKSKEVEGVTIYYQNTFDKDKGGFKPSKKAEVHLTNDAISGRALETICKVKWAGPALNVSIKGSKKLKIVFLAKGINFGKATINFFDQKARDNTTPYGYRFLPNNEWTPVLYYVDLFRYNSKRSGYISSDTHFTSLRFWGPEAQGKIVKLILDNFAIYRGEDLSPPAQVKDLRVNENEDGVFLFWQPAKDNVFPMVYVVSRAEGEGSFIKIAETYHPWYKDQQVKKNISYRYRVLAVDFQNNLSPWSNIVQITPKENHYLYYEETIWERDRKNYAEHVREVHKRGAGKVNKGLVVLFGDSLTFPTSYPRFVAGALGIYRVKAYGYPRQTTGFGRRKVKEILAKEKPEFLFVMFGTNNVRGMLRPRSVYERWVDDLEAIVRQAEAQGVITALATIPPRGFKDPRSLPEAKFNEVLVERARELKIPIAYIFEAVQEGGNRREFIWKDGVHWTAKGMELAAWTWRKMMRQVEFALRDRP